MHEFYQIFHAIPIQVIILCIPSWKHYDNISSPEKYIGGQT